VKRKGKFAIVIPLRGIRPGVVTEFTIKCDKSFSPSDYPDTREDYRRLSYQVTSSEYRRKWFGFW
jgi:hypothetical protein